MKTVKSGTAIIAEPKRTTQKGELMRAIDADALTEDCKRYLGTLNPDRDGKECTRIHWLIGVLENAPTIDTELCEDAVSRRKAFEYFVSLWECIGTIMDREEWEDVCKTTANELPSVAPKRKTGQWLDNYQCGYKCSECGAYLEIDCGDVEMNFCPNCSADMRGEQDEQHSV